MKTQKTDVHKEVGYNTVNVLCNAYWKASHSFFLSFLAGLLLLPTRQLQLLSFPSINGKGTPHSYILEMEAAHLR